MYGQALNNLALFYENQKRPAEAAPWFQEAARLMAEYGRRNLPGLNESEQLAFWQQNRTVIDNFLLFVARYAALPDFQALLGPALQLRLQTKGALLRVNAEQVQKRKSAQNPALDSLYQRWRKNRQCLAYLAQESVSDPSQGPLDSLIKATDQLEKQMALRQFRPLVAETPAAENWQTLQADLQAGEAALEMTRLMDAQGQVYYWAMLVVKEAPLPLSVLIPDGQALEKNYWHFYTNNIQFKIKDTQSFDRYWQPIQALLDQYQVKRLYFSPDGVYHLLNPPALYEPARQAYLANRLDLVHLSNLQALLRRDGDNAQPQGAVLVGGLEYGPASAGESFKPLPGTQTEIENIAALFQKYQNARPTLWQDSEAGKAALLNLQNPGLLHLATHGFFYPPPAIVGESLASEVVSPLLRAGLALSGANQGEAGFREGLLSAYEVSEMQLEETELVVLSACQTGMGQVEDGEGVYGLQRAFHLAGAKQVLVSLWAVNDQVGQQWMQYFYENYLQTHRADLALRYARSKVQAAFTAPYYWAGFVLWEK
ncbi:MAG: CHAT domain-containing protein [Microscillaceae bacterium]|nr:CHAT domain-containing protein [Microscillaceae bacterium]